MMEEIECKITGRVQMVLFRDFVQRKASGFDIAGTVENQEDGSVKVVAQGKKEDLDKLIECLHKGPFLARVARVETMWREPKEELKGFKILY